MLPAIKGSKSSGEETWTFQYNDRSATIKYGQKRPDEPGKKPTYARGLQGQLHRWGAGVQAEY